MAPTPLAQDLPALQAASQPEKARILGLIEGCEERGQRHLLGRGDPAGDQRRAHRRVPRVLWPAGSFKINYQLLATGTLVTRVEQEIAADRVTIDVAAIGSPPWVFARVNKGDALEYASPQCRLYEQAFANGLGKNGFFAFNGAYLFVPMWDASRTTFDGKSWNDVFGAVPAGRMTIGDVSKSVTYLDTLPGRRPSCRRNTSRNSPR